MSTLAVVSQAVPFDHGAAVAGAIAGIFSFGVGAPVAWAAAKLYHRGRCLDAKSVDKCNNTEYCEFKSSGCSYNEDAHKHDYDQADHQSYPIPAVTTTTAAVVVATTSSSQPATTPAPAVTSQPVVTGTKPC